MYFFLILLVKRGKLLAHNWFLRLPSNRLCYFSLTVASCFKLVDEEYIKELKDKNENENSKNSMEY